MDAKTPPKIPTLAELAGEGAEGFDGFGAQPTDGLPRLKLVQPKSGGAQPGTFENSATGACTPVIDNLVILRAQRIRRRYGQNQGFAGESPLLCWSDDGVVPNPRVKAPGAAKCETCTHGKWPDDRSRPECNEVATTVVGVGPERDQFLLDFSGPARRAFFFVYSTSCGKKLPLFGLVLRLSSTAKKNAKDETYFSMVVEIKHQLPDAEVPTVYAAQKKAKTIDLSANKVGG